jgi:ribosome-binding protein aMBF1 (putative translation factor)
MSEVESDKYRDIMHDSLEDLVKSWTDGDGKEPSNRATLFVAAEELCGPAVGRRLKSVREQKGISAGDLAARAKLSSKALSRLETSPLPSDRFDLATVCRVLGIGLNELAAETPRSRGWFRWFTRDERSKQPRPSRKR